MNFCAIICEFNPFHNGHKYILEKARMLSGCDAVLCIMSGSFTQRGDMGVLDKHVRAKHAILGGADCVLQLPSPFAVAPAEIFAKGAIKILSSIPEVKTLAFGCESGDEQSFLNAAKLLNSETENFKNTLSEKLACGESYIKSYSAAFEACGGDKNLLSNPNNVLGLEYTKAILRANANIEILPIKRIGAAYNDGTLKDNYSSASAIRQNLNSETIKNNVPAYVYSDIKISDNKYATEMREYENVLRHSLFKCDVNELKKIYGCSEGLEHKLKSLENESYADVIEKATSKRYSSSRIKRILLANALGFYQRDTQTFLNSDLYLRPLAVKQSCADKILQALSKSYYPIITGARGDGLQGAAGLCFEKDIYEYSLFKHITHSDHKDYMILV